MTVQQTLAEMRHLMKQRGRLQDDISRAMALATNASPVLSKMPKQKKVSEKVAVFGTYCADLQAQIDNINHKLVLFQADVVSAITAIPVGSEKQALSLRYIELLPVRQVAKRMNYEREAMYLLLRKSESKWLS